MHFINRRNDRKLPDYVPPPSTYETMRRRKEGITSFLCLSAGNKIPFALFHLFFIILVYNEFMNIPWLLKLVFFLLQPRKDEISPQLYLELKIVQANNKR